MRSGVAVRIEIPSAGRVFTPGADAGLALVSRAARSHLTGVADPKLATLAAALAGKEGAWAHALTASHRNRLSTFVLAGLKENAVAVPEAAQASLDLREQRSLFDAKSARQPCATARHVADQFLPLCTDGAKMQSTRIAFECRCHESREIA